MVVILRQKIGSGATRTCSSTCHMATKDKCACICSGKFHRLGFKPKDVEEARAKAQERYHEKEFCAEKHCDELGIPPSAEVPYVCPTHIAAYRALIVKEAV